LAHFPPVTHDENLRLPSEATRPNGKYTIAKSHFAERVAIEPEQRGSNCKSRCYGGHYNSSPIPVHGFMQAT
jgi:hypothetical protein